MLPIATTSGASAGWLVALFTATSAVCVTGLAVVDTETHWSVFGEVVIAGLIQVGGLGIDVLMFIGRTGPLTFGSALALKHRTRRYELPEQPVIVG
ncbi:potassium transporter TrkG [Nonomuraea purpurea]|uniref:Potassium transporter TrkG n=1 Tax=Nonomuraea purpurea TaxID=1849276 RepID=A0ABV8GUX4_9ACTN